MRAQVRTYVDYKLVFIRAIIDRHQIPNLTAGA